MELKIKVDGIEHKVEAQLMKGTLWVHANGRTYSMDASGRKSRKRAGPAGSSDTISAPMPGKVTKILLQPGAFVKVGQAVLVMEAMKMEYTLKSEVDGVVESVFANVAEQVALGKALVKIIPSADK